MENHLQESMRVTLTKSSLFVNFAGVDNILRNPSAFRHEGARISQITFGL